jgi:curli production assembly/transport component CsgF
MQRLALLTSVSLLFASTIPVASQDLTYRPINPSFGGNPLSSSHLLGTAAAQREATARDADDDDATFGPGGDLVDDGPSDADLFVRQLEGRLLSALAGQVTEAIFGDNPAEEGTVVFGSTTVSFERTVGEISLQIIDALDGTVTEIVVPQLVVQ